MLWPNREFDSERPLFKLSENHKITVIGPTKLKILPFKNALFNATAPPPAPPTSSLPVQATPASSECPQLLTVKFR